MSVAYKTPDRFLRCSHGIGSTIERMLVTAINQTPSCKEAFLSTLQNDIETVLKVENGQPLTNIDKRRLGKLHPDGYYTVGSFDTCATPPR